MKAHKDDLKPFESSTAHELYLDHMATHNTEATGTGHHYRTQHFVS